MYQKPAETFVSRQRLAVQRAEDLQGHKFEDDEAGTATDAAHTSAAAPDLLDLDGGTPPKAQAAAKGVSGAHIALTTAWLFA